MDTVRRSGSPEVASSDEIRDGKRKRSREPSPELGTPLNRSLITGAVEKSFSGSENECENPSLFVTPTKANGVVPSTPTRKSGGEKRRKLTPEERLLRQKEVEDKKRRLEEEKQAREEKKQKDACEREEKRVAEARKKEELKRQKDEEKQKKDEEKKRKDQEKEEEKRKKDQEREEEKKRKEEERLKKDKEKDEEKKRKDEERARKDEQKRLREEEKRKRENEKREIERKAEAVTRRQQEFMGNFVAKIPPSKPDILEGSDKLGVLFQGYEVQKGVMIAFRHRTVALSPRKLSVLDECVAGTVGSRYADKKSLYISELKNGTHLPKRSPATCLKTVKLVTIFVGGHERTVAKFKLMQFSENSRPAYYGTMQRTSKTIRPRNPFAEDTNLIDYEVDSDEDWDKDEDKGDSVQSNEDDSDEDDGGDENDNDGFLDNDLPADQSTESAQEDYGMPKVRSFVDQLRERERSDGGVRRLVRNVLYAPNGEKCPDTLVKLTIIRIPQFDNEIVDQATAHEELGPAVGLIPLPIMPCFIRMLHGSRAGRVTIARMLFDLLEQRPVPEQLTLVAADLELIKTIERPKNLSKMAIENSIQIIASFDVPPSTETVQKRCWYVRENIRKLYAVLETASLPNLHCVPKRPSAVKIDRPKAEKVKKPKMRKPKTPVSEKIVKPTSEKTDKPKVEKRKKSDSSTGSEVPAKSIKIQQSPEISVPRQPKRITLDSWVRKPEPEPILIVVDENN